VIIAIVIFGVLAVPAFPPADDEVAALPPDEEHAPRARAAARDTTTAVTGFLRIMMGSPFEHHRFVEAVL
jgi:hypothetical protein